MKKCIKLWFADKWTGHIPQEDLYYRLLARHYDVVLDPNPEYLIFSQFGHSSIKYDCIKIADVGENIVPDFNLTDYAVGFDHLTFGDRYLRVPLFVFYGYGKVMDHENEMSDEHLLNRKFCSFVVSNGVGGDPIRARFFKELSKYKKIDSGGRFMNNVGGPVSDKLSFLRDHKFNISFESGASDGYTTEKILDAYKSRTMPVYWGNPRIGEDFRSESMIHVRDTDDIPRAVDEIVALDKDDAAYLERMRCPFLIHDYTWYEKQLEEFLCHIVDQPIEKARRINRFGFQAVHVARVRHLYRVDDFLKAPLRKARQLVQKVRRSVKK